MSLFAALLLLAEAPAGQPRIEDIRQDVPPADIEKAAAVRARALASEAYIWGFPAFLHFRQTTEIKQSRKYLSPDEEPFGGWVLVDRLSTPETNNALPNVDTLYGANYVHLGRQGPIVLRVPAIGNRYYSVAVLDAYFNNFAVLGTRENGGGARAYLIVPPGWEGTPPQGMQVIRAPTPMVSLYQRIYVNGDADIPAVRALQKQITVAPLSGGAFPRIETPEFDASSPVRETRDPLDYFTIVNRYTTLNPPPIEYASQMAAFADAGIGPGQILPSSSGMISALREGAADAQATINAEISRGPFRNGWRVPDPRGATPGPYALSQAVLQASQIGSLPMNEAVYYVGRRDARGEMLDGRHDYELTFPAGQLPPVAPKGFWSVTMYKASDSLLVANPIDRYVIRPSTPGLMRNADGSLTIRMAAQQPRGVPSGNWLPSPGEPFVVAIRAYLPTAPILDGSWFPPGIVRLSGQNADTRTSGNNK